MTVRKIAASGRRFDVGGLVICFCAVVVFATAVVGANAGSAGSAGSGAGAVSLPDDPLRGRVLFETKGCVQCHGIAGSASSIGPRLGEGQFGGTFLELGASLWNHVPGMSVTFEVAQLPWPELSAQESTELMAFLYFIDYLGQPGTPAAGERVFSDQGCTFCHEIAGGSAEVGPDLVGLERFASPLYVAQQIWNHGPSMLKSMREMNMPAPTFAEGDLADLSAFIRQEAEGGAQEQLFLSPGNPNHGREVFGQKGCKKCHGDGGRGGSDGPDLGDADLRRSAEGIAGTMWNHSLAMQDLMLERGVGWPQFGGGELADLLAFLYFIPFSDPPGDASRGADLFVDRACAECHASSDLQQESGDRGPDLTGTQVGDDSAAMVSAMWNHAPLMKRSILGQGLPWPELSGSDLRDLWEFLQQEKEAQ